MEKVHILVWLSDGRIGGVYADYEKACRVAKETNKKRTWFQRLFVDTKWVVQTFDVKS